MTFDGPHDTRQAAGAVRFEANAMLEGIVGAEVLGLMMDQKLRLGYSMHGQASASPIECTGRVALDLVDETTLRCRFVLPKARFNERPVRLLHVGMFYEGLGSFEDWGYRGAWLVVGMGEVDLFKKYFRGFNADLT